MASAAGRTLNLATLGGAGWVAAVHPAWRDDLAAGGWLRRAPIDPDRHAGRVADPEPSGRGEIYRVQFKAGPAVVRPVRRGSWLRPLLGSRLLGPRRPLAEIRVTAALRTRGAPVPEPVMALAWRASGPFWHALVATREEANSLDGRAFLATRPPRAMLRDAVRAAGSALRDFHDAGGRHRDLNLGNLLIQRVAGGSARVWIIDLDGARAGPIPSPRQRMQELMRLHRSLRKSARGDLLRLSVGLFHSYCRGDRELRARMLRWRRLEALRVAIHALHYRPH